jgi:hypothetical protein
MKPCTASMLLFALAGGVAKAETPDEWIALGTRVHGGFGSSFRSSA